MNNVSTGTVAPKAATVASVLADIKAYASTADKAGNLLATVVAGLVGLKLTVADIKGPGKLHDGAKAKEAKAHKAAADKSAKLKADMNAAIVAGWGGWRAKLVVLDAVAIQAGKTPKFIREAVGSDDPAEIAAAKRYQLQQVGSRRGKIERALDAHYNPKVAETRAAQQTEGEGDSKPDAPTSPAKAVKQHRTNLETSLLAAFKATDDRVNTDKIKAAFTSIDLLIELIG